MSVVPPRTASAVRTLLLGLTAGALTVGGLTSLPTATAVVAAAGPPSGGPAAAGSSSPGNAAFAGSRPTPHPVAPKITDTKIPAVPLSARTSSGGMSLAAQLRDTKTQYFSMLGVTWDHGTAPAGTVVKVRTQNSTGEWTPWSKLEIDPSEGPAPGQDSELRDGTNPVWSGPSTGVEVDVYTPTGQLPSGLQVNKINPGTSAYDKVIGSGAKSAFTADRSLTARHKRLAGTFPGIPDIITRKQWGADPSLGDRCWNPRFGNAFKMVFIHHTAGSNNYTERESPAIVRGVYAFHTQSRGWCDIAYNFLVDKYGNIYEGRRGGIRRPVRGAHAGDYNVDTTGISLMGNFDTAYPSRAMKHALVRLVAWRMGTAYHGGYGHARVYGHWFKRISGHRDAMQTSCPGNHAYAWLPQLRKRVATRLGDFESKIEQRWRALGAAKGRLGNVILGEQGENGGKHTTFEGGRIYNSPNGVFVDYAGPILRRYVKQGETGSTLGYPSSKVWSVGQGKGLAQQFAGGRIYFSPQTGSKTLVKSSILKRYRKLGAAIGPLGFPKTPIFHFAHGVKARFQNGTIIFHAATKRTTVKYS